MVSADYGFFSCGRLLVTVLDSVRKCLVIKVLQQ